MPERKVTFTNSHGVKLSGILAVPKTKNPPIVILCHGFTTGKNSKKYIALKKILEDRKIASLRFDFFGHGESGGNFADITITEAVDDVLNAVKFVRKKGFTRIGLSGASFGGIACFIAASKLKGLFGLAAISPVSDWPAQDSAAFTKAEMRDWKKKGFMTYKNSFGKEMRLNYSIYEDSKKHIVYKVAKKISAPTLIVHGSADEEVPVSQSRKTAKLIPDCVLKEIKGSNHHYSKKRDFNRMMRLVSTFLIKKAST